MRTSAIALLAVGVFLAADHEGTLRPGDVAPEIEVKDWFNSPPGYSLADLRGRVILLEYWATW